ncbi:hypothetical protein KY290_024020 [Solanum tuberosum]|uniref:Isopentenyltransferase n=1 Tax=Solanum tuberosum TaxID=4113 RepID=A0ABQ7UPI4_SOLTU|nr:hypothetical protein KY285_022767 [Solanum tuberosum]KAH0753750.1 hypothetical protein KY290_024020 [Solanum tuberosum]
MGLVIIMGPTATGKSKLTIDSAKCFNDSDTIQVFTRSEGERRGGYHHLLGELPDPEFSSSDFRFIDNNRVSDINNRRKLPFIINGSNPLIKASLSRPVLNGLLSKRIDEMYDELKNEFSDRSTGLMVPEEVKRINENTRYLTGKQMCKIQRVEAMEAYRRRCRRETARFRQPKFGKDKLYY